MIPKHHRAPAAAALVTLGCFFLLAGDGVRGYFVPDDMMNLYLAWDRPFLELLRANALFFEGGIRPFPALFYRFLYGLFGLNPFPFHILNCAILTANLAVLYFFCRRVSRSREVAALACLLGAYHAHLADLYHSSATLYDLLCFLCYYGTLVYYMKIRDTGRFPGVRGTVFCIFLYLCALNSKEMAVTLPFVLLAYELLIGPEKSESWRSQLNAARRSGFVWIACAITLIYIYGKIAGPGRITTNPDYTPVYSLHTFLSGWRHYLTDLFYGTIRFTSAKVILLWLVLTAVALRSGRRDLMFAGLLLTAGALPVLFVPPRGFYVMYLALPGWYLFGGRVLVMMREALLRAAARCSAVLGVRTEQTALYLVVLAILLPMHFVQRGPGMAWLGEAHAAVRSVDDYLTSNYPHMPRGARILFLTDPYEKGDWILTSLFRLHYGDKEIRVERVKDHPALADAAQWQDYDYVFRMDGWKLQDVRSGAQAGQESTRADRE
jgi:hypothetical protein